VSSRGEQDAVRAAGAAGATRSLVLYFTMAMAGAIAAARWRSPPPLAGSYGVDVDSTRLARAHGVSLASTLALQFWDFFIPSRGAARPIRPAPAADFVLATFLFSDSAAPATHGRRAIAPRARRSMATAPGSNEAPLLTLPPTLALRFWIFFIPSRGAARHPHQPPELDFSF